MKNNRPATETRLVDRRGHSSEAIVVLAGYKQFAWADVFGRLNRFAPQGMDVLVVSAGLWDDDLDRICSDFGWSYLSVEENNVPFALNLAISVCPQAVDIWKIDEDMFLTENFFPGVRRAHDTAVAEGDYEVGFTAPTINVNGYSYLSILDHLGIVENYEKAFGRAYYGAIFPNAVQPIQDNPAAAKFLWGLGGQVPHVDDLDRELARNPFRYSICHQRFSIGAILLPRHTWEQMGMFSAPFGSINLGRDERDLCHYCMDRSRAIVIAENTAVGHLGFKEQAAEMERFYMSRPEHFELRS